MNPDMRRQVELLYQGVAGQPADVQQELLASGDPEICREVKALLDRNVSMAAPLSGQTTLGRIDFIPDAGTQLGPYRVERQIGAGGMGLVFRAIDTRLNRAVAIKTATAGFDARFQREARAIAQLNHPHICTVHDIGPNYLVMELLEGLTLAARLKKGPMPIDEVFLYGAQIANALAAAHEKGIVHRDLKPANIFLTRQAGMKVLDFGLARSVEDEALTAANVTVGTPAYMSPEQRQGKTCDARSDIYSLGLVLREMLTGSRDGPLANAPMQLAHIISRCLETEPGERWQSASDIRWDLDWGARNQVRSGMADPRATGRWFAWTIAAAAVLALAVVSTQQRTRDAATPDQAAFTMMLDQGPAAVPVPSPDGRYLAFLSEAAGPGQGVWVRALDSVQARRLAGTEGSSGTIVWSPDSGWIAFFTDGKLKKIRVAGGPAETIASLAGFQDADWGSSGEFIFRASNREPLSLVRVGGAVQGLTKLNAALTENSHRFPTFLPDGYHFLYVTRCAERANNALYLASIASPEVEKIMPAEGRVSYVAGSVLFYRDGALRAQRFDADKGRLTGEVAVVASDVAYAPPSLLASFRASARGEVLITASSRSALEKLVWYTRDGIEAGTAGEPGVFEQLRISPDGTRVAFESPDPQTGNRDVWYIELTRGIKARVTRNVANDWFPVWSPDGREIAFSSDRAGGTAMLPFVKNAADADSSERAIGSTGRKLPLVDWSRDGKWLLFDDREIDVAPAANPDAPVVYLKTPPIQFAARFSPDGKWIAYSSNESGQSEIYARPFDGGPAAPEKIRISTAGGEYPAWNATGDELYYMDADGSIYATSMRNAGRSVTAPPSMRLFQACPESRPANAPLSGAPYLRDFDTPDGKKFLVSCRAEARGRFTVMTNWLSRVDFHHL